MFRVKKSVEVVALETRTSSVPVAIEQFPAMKFNNNAAGWSKNDLAALVAATTKQEYDMLVERLKVNEPQFNVKDETKVEDAIKSIKPRWCQSANEIVSYVDALTRQNLDDAYRKSLEDVNFNKEKTPVDESSGVDSTE